MMIVASSINITFDMIVSNDMTSSSSISSSVHDNNGSQDDSNKPVPLPLDESIQNQLERL